VREDSTIRRRDVHELRRRARERVGSGDYQIVSKYAFSRKPYQQTPRYWRREHAMGPYTHVAGRQVAFVASMGALGNVLALVTLSIPTPVGQIAFDFSHIGTLVVALYSGPLLGGMTGAIVGMAPYYRFGVAGGFGPILGLMIIPGKSLTGITAGLLASKLRPALATIIGYVPEAIFTFSYFEWVAPFFLGPKAGAFVASLVVPVLAKAWLEMIVIAAVMELIRRQHILSRLMPSMN